LINTSDIFKDLVVIELASVLAGPAVGMFFAELGARVIKIEALNGGDVTRKWKLATEDPKAKDSAYFNSINYNKEHLFLDLEMDSALHKLYGLIESADIVISNFKPSSALRLKVDYTSVANIKSDIIYTELIAFNKNSKKIGYDAVMQAEAGFLSMSGTTDGALVKMPVALIDLMAAHQMKEAILIALLKKFKSGKGSHISVSLLESGIASLANQASNFLNAQHLPKPMGTLHPNIAPYGELFKLKDGNTILLAIGNDAQFKRLIDALEIPENSDYKTNVQRLENRETLFELLSIKISTCTVNQIEELFESSSIPYGQVKNMEQVMDYAHKNDLILTSTGEKGEVQRVRSIVFKFLA